MVNLGLLLFRGEEPSLIYLQVMFTLFLLKEAKKKGWISTVDRLCFRLTQLLFAKFEYLKLQNSLVHSFQSDHKYPPTHLCLCVNRRQEQLPPNSKQIQHSQMLGKICFRFNWLSGLVVECLPWGHWFRSKNRSYKNMEPIAWCSGLGVGLGG